MRLLSLCGLLATLLAPSLCERRNPTVCSNDPGFECAAGEYCELPTGSEVGRCQPAQCSASQNSCPTEKPLCDRGVCTRCVDSGQCTSLFPETPICDDGRCVACSRNSDCRDAARPVCDGTTHVCRACQLHADCASGVCAKDDSFASLPRRIERGSCVDASRVNVVMPTCNTAACLQGVLNNLVDADRPYVLIKGNYSFGGRLTIAATSIQKSNGVPSFYLIGPNADLPPSNATNLPSLRFSSGSGAAITVSPGAHTIFEGFVVVNSGVGISCQGSAPTRIRILRSFIGGNQIGLNAAAQCELAIDASWIGKGPSPHLLGFFGNELAMQLDGTRLDVVNSVFWHNGTVGAFGGIRLIGAVMPARIVSSTFVDHNFKDVTRPPLAIDCTSATGGQLSIVNTLFVNDAGPSGGTTYVHRNCRPPGTLFGVVSNDADLVDANNMTNLANTGLNYRLFVDQPSGDLHLASGAPDAVKRSGVTQAQDAQGSIPIPTTDMDGRPRGPGAITSGAFEAQQ